MSKTSETTAIAAAITLLASSGAVIASPQTSSTVVASHLTLDQYGRPAVKGSDVSGQISSAAKNKRAISKVSLTNCHTCQNPTA